MGVDSLDFDLQQLFRSIDHARSDRGLTWAALARQVGVASSTIRRFESAADAEADGVLTLIS
jgi:ribosome-binding protein aMBF1 (putative translation factor)